MAGDAALVSSVPLRTWEETVITQVSSPADCDWLTLKAQLARLPPDSALLKETSPRQRSHTEQGCTEKASMQATPVTFAFLEKCSQRWTVRPHAADTSMFEAKKMASNNRKVEAGTVGCSRA